MSELIIPGTIDNQESVFLDSFDHWQTNNYGKWTYCAGSTQTSIVRNGSRALKLEGGTAGVAYRQLRYNPIYSNYTTMCAVYPTKVSVYSHNLISHVADYYQLNFNIIIAARVHLWMTATNELNVSYSFSSFFSLPNITVLPTGVHIPDNLWSHVGLYTNLTQDPPGTVSGDIEVFVNGESVYSTSISTSIFGGIFGWTTLQIGGGYSTQLWTKDIYFDDLLVFTGYKYGDYALGVIRPDGDIEQEWTPDVGTTGWDRVNDELIDSDSSMLTRTGSEKNLFSLQDIPDATEIAAIQSVVYADKEAGGLTTFYPRYGQAGYSDIYYSNTPLYPVGNQVRFLHHNLTVNPFTGLPYTVQDVNDMQFGIK